ncbi:hypothetical protein DDB_G0278683 [Dictyostelium discoideum AX4]|uniref:very-long-chain (3R)-3-hydroxyacyl-CoA dehydratase n=1 Tax=Dictyostelium discoideum TaxID=44689 RepID=Q54Y54_DICDI|nr:hypothetical protein DDB_G0278683 [Dictyostelium discoideum AX4]EAL68514.1 hypothetical protein DDB_G0278683 [Dictyostelium discoideum AX4]|eukprot:XP_642348.1 hypothetical protein DDB_G0278683 [Dictyostelium discoideum AX4]
MVKTDSALYLGFSSSIPTTYISLGSTVCFVQVLAFLEILHVLLGFTKSSLIPTMSQVFGRNHVLLLALAFTPEVQRHWGVWTMFFIWGLSELIRFPYYLYGSNSPKFLTWLRYNAFIILYPLGFLSENILWYNMLPIILERRIHFIDMPNKFNFGFNYYYFLLVWITLTLMVFPQQYMHMFKLRAKKMN